jgi:ribosome-associated translation inhibitor RaiA
MEPNSRPARERTSLRIEVASDMTITSQARTYAEYRVFAALTQSAGTRHARSARVVLRRVNPDSRCSEVACLVTVRLESKTVRVRATGAHAYAAINRAVEHLRDAPERSSAERIPS